MPFSGAEVPRDLGRLGGFGHETERCGDEVRHGEERCAAQGPTACLEGVDGDMRDHVGDDKATGDKCELLHVLLLRNCSMSDASNLVIY